MKTVKELMGATNPMESKLEDIRFSTDEEGHSDLQLTDMELATEKVDIF
mgnify:CR=1 FL=1